MVELTPAVLPQGITSVSLKSKNPQDRAKEFHKVTHLHLQQKDLTSLISFQAFTSLSVLYLYDNKLASIEGLEQAYNLEILQLQRNRIQRISNLQGCLRLRKLYIGYNEIETIEGLENQQALQELHVEHQRLPRGGTLAFDPKCILALGDCLIHLNISGNSLTHLEDLKGLRQLRNLVATNNPITNLENLTSTMNALVSVHSLDIRNAPVCKRPHFKERIVGSSHNIVILNEKEVPDNCRQFFKRFAAVKATRKQAKAKAVAKLMEEQLTMCSGQMAGAAGGDSNGPAAPEVDLQKHNLSLHLPGTSASSSVDSRRKTSKTNQPSPRLQDPDNLKASSPPSENPKLEPPTPADVSSEATLEAPKRLQNPKRPQFLLAPANFSTANFSPEDWATSASHRHGSWSSRSSQKPMKLSRSPRLPTSERKTGSSKPELWSGRGNLAEGRHILKFVKPLSTSDVRSDFDNGDHDLRANSAMSLNGTGISKM